MADFSYMREAIDLALCGRGLTRPNPIVGAVVVRAGKIIAKGFHKKAGGPHAEVEALAELVGEDLSEATLYVTLEPCSTWGLTPPCSERIIESGLRGVVVGATDPNPRHAGRGFEVLRNHGIEVTHGVLEKECEELNPGFNKWIRTGLPFVIAKFAMTLDGRLTLPPGGSRWLSSAKSRQIAHELRGRVDAVAVGAGTALIDDPLLTSRTKGGRAFGPQPLRVVFKGTRPIPKNLRLLESKDDEALILEGRPLGAALRLLGKRGVQSVLIEGGSRLLGAFCDANAIDEYWAFLTPWTAAGDVPAIGGDGVPGNERGLRLRDVRYESVGDDVLCVGKLDRG